MPDQYCIQGCTHGKGNFLLKILYTQNDDIQGTIQWLEEERTVNFRSFLELTALLYEAVGLIESPPVSHP
ncbi:MAG: hypothetical protein GXY50_02840 [Syntrophomonadaceae bacterium]|nr:hypothetical protein [Syntrophomonadaceae bacterium]